MSTLYFKKGANADWNTVGNWWTDSGCTVQAAHVPWVSGDSTYLAYNLQYGSGTDTVSISADILAEASGSCALTCYNYVDIYGGTFTAASFINGGGSVVGGTFTGASFKNYNAIYGGTFTGTSFTSYSGAAIFGGTFTGTSFANNCEYIGGGTFTGASLHNNGSIYGGVFTGASFTNSTTGILYCGMFLGSSFANNGSIYGGMFTGASFTNTADIFGGEWWLSGRMKVQGNIYSASGDANPSAFFSTLYTDDASTIGTGDVVKGRSFTALGTTVNGTYVGHPLVNP
jgi:hypothetical protein